MDSRTRCKQQAEEARGHFAGGFIDGHDTAGVQRGVAFGIVGGKDLELGVRHEQVAGVVVELDLAVQRDAHAGQKQIGQIAAMKPLAEQALAGSVFEDGLEQAQTLAAETGEVRRLHFRDDRGHLAGRKLRDGLDVGAVFVAEGSVGQQILDREQRFRLEHLRASRSDALYILKWSGEIQERDPSSPV